MTVTMDRAGRLVIPSEIRREAGIEPGAPLEIRLRDGVVEIEPQAMQVRFEQQGHLLVAVPVRPVPPLTSAMVERTRRAIHATRARRARR